MQIVSGFGLEVSDFMVLVMILVGLVVSVSEVISNYKNPKALKSGLLMASFMLFLPAGIAIYVNYIPKGTYTAHTIVIEAKTMNEKSVHSKPYTFDLLYNKLKVDGFEYTYNKEKSNALVRVYSSKVQASSITVTLMGNVQHYHDGINTPSKIHVDV